MPTCPDHANGTKVSVSRCRNRANRNAYPRERKKSLKNLRILIVDNDATLLNLLTLVISRVCPDCQVVSTADGASALTELQNLTNSQAFDLLLTDYEMPAMNGLELAQAARVVSPGTRIVLMTGFLQISELLDDLEAVNLTGILLKPFSQKELKQALEIE